MMRIEIIRQTSKLPGRVTEFSGRHSEKTVQRYVLIRHEDEDLGQPDSTIRPAVENPGPAQDEAGHINVIVQKARAVAGQHRVLSHIEVNAVRQKRETSRREGDARCRKGTLVPPWCDSIRQNRNTIRHISGTFQTAEKANIHFCPVVFHCSNDATYTCRKTSLPGRSGSHPRPVATGMCWRSSYLCRNSSRSSRALHILGRNGTRFCPIVCINCPFPSESCRMACAVRTNNTGNMRIASASSPATYPHKYIFKECLWHRKSI
jgi:hypothetical protein